MTMKTTKQWLLMNAALAAAHLLFACPEAAAEDYWMIIEGTSWSSSDACREADLGCEELSTEGTKCERGIGPEHVTSQMASNDGQPARLWTCRIICWCTE